MSFLIKIKILLLSICIGGYAQSPFQQIISKNFGGSGADRESFVVQNKFGDYYITGISNSTNPTNNPNFDIPSNNGNFDIWVAKLSSAGNLIWKRSLGGSGVDRPLSITTDIAGNAIVLCEVGVADIDFVNGTNGALWMLNIDLNNTMVVKKHYGGDGAGAGKIKRDLNGGFLILRNIQTSNGQVTPLGMHDLWLLKTDNLGNIVWQKSYGGTGEETAADFLQEGTNIYLLGTSGSANVNGAISKGTNDVLLIKTNATGIVSNTYLYGGSLNDIGVQLLKGDNTSEPYIILANSNSSNGDLLFNQGNLDYWVFSVDNNGLIFNTLLNYGTNEDDFAIGMIYDGSDITPITIIGNSINQYTPGQAAGSNVILSRFGALSISPDYLQIIGGSQDDFATQMISDNRGDMVFAGYSSSADSMLTNNYGNFDFWFYKGVFPCPQNLTITASELTGNTAKSASVSISISSKIIENGTLSTMVSPSITMQPGFEVKQGVIFKAEPGNCP